VAKDSSKITDGELLRLLVLGVRSLKQTKKKNTKSNNPYITTCFFGRVVLFEKLTLTENNINLS